MSDVDPLLKPDLADEQQHLSTSLLDRDQDIGASHIGEVYARALLGAAENEGKTAEVIAELDALIVEVIDKHPQFIELLAAENISLAERRGVFERVFANRLSPLLMHFLRVVINHGRGRCLRAIHRAAHDLLDEMRGRVRVTVVSAVPLDPTISKLVREHLRAALKIEPVLEQSVNPDLIGGAVFRVGDTVFDGSVSTQLKQMRHQMIDRSVHEIQSRRDRFRTTDGN